MAHVNMYMYIYEVFRLTHNHQMLAVRTELEDRVSDLQTQLIDAQEDVAKMRDENQQLKDQLSVQEAKLVRVSE